MFCTKCGKKLKDGARFCTACGMPTTDTAPDSVNTFPERKEGECRGSLFPQVDSECLQEERYEGESVNGDDLGGSAARFNQGAKRSLAAELMKFRRTTLGAVPTFILAIFAILAVAGTAYALFRIVADVVIPAFEFPAKDEFARDEGTRDDADRENEEAHAAYGEVLTLYRDLAQNYDYPDYNAVIQDDPERYALINETAVIDFKLDYLVYSFVDIDHDAVDELVLSSASDEYGVPEAGNIHTIYDYANGKVFISAKGWARNFYRLCNDDLLMVSGSGGYLTHGYAVFRYDEAQILPSNLTERHPLESLSYDSEDGKNITIRHCKDGKILEEVTEAVEERRAENGGTVFTSKSLQAMCDDFMAKYPLKEGLHWEHL